MTTKLDPDTIDAVSRTVRAELIELRDIKSTALQDGVVAAWAYALVSEGYRAISDLQGSGAPDYLVLKHGSQLDHIRGVTRLSMRYGDELKAMFAELPLDRDVLIAGAMLHDVGKPHEYNPERRKLWSERPHVSGFPATRHPVHGWHICLTVGLPEAVAHVAASHSREGALIVRSLEAEIVHHCDQSYWSVLRIGNQLVESPPTWAP
jgi:putative nucleotidyltransferase with HDIG domain